MAEVTDAPQVRDSGAMIERSGRGWWVFSGAAGAQIRCGQKANGAQRQQQRAKQLPPLRLTSPPQPPAAHLKLSE